MRFAIEVLSELGEARAISAEGSRVVVGATADVAIEGHELAGEHLAIEPDEDGCRVTLLAGAPFLVEGLAHDGGKLAWGTEISIGALRLRLAREARAVRSAPSPIVLSAPIVLAGALWIAFSGPPAGGIPAPPPPPALFGEEEARCDTGAAPAHHRAERDEEAALAKSQRYPFAPGDGVEAVRLYRHAAACFAASGDEPAARRARARATSMERRVTADYSTTRFRLERALERGDWASATAEASVLLELLAGEADPYVEWLATLERRLRLAQTRADRSES